MMPIVRRVRLQHGASPVKIPRQRGDHRWRVRAFAVAGQDRIQAIDRFVHRPVAQRRGIAAQPRIGFRSEELGDGVGDRPRSRRPPARPAVPESNRRCSALAPACGRCAPRSPAAAWPSASLIAARTRLADEQIRQRHVIRHVPREALPRTWGRGCAWPAGASASFRAGRTARSVESARPPG